MKNIIYTLLSAGILLVANLFVSNGTLQVEVETPTGPPTPTFVPLPGTVVPTLIGGPTQIPTTSVVSEDPYGELYFTVELPKEYFPPATPPPGVYEATYRLVRLPGSCMVGLIECPAPDVIPTPFDMKDVLAIDSDSGAMTWSPDGRYGVITVHPPDDTTKGWTADEWEQFKTRRLDELNISPSTLYLFDAETDTWRELYRANRKFFYTSYWSPDGQWIAFTVASSMVSFHPFQVDDGVYVVHPDGSGLQRLGRQGYILGWVGNKILMRRFLHPGSESDSSHVIEKLDFNGQVTTLFESSRVAKYALAPDGGSLLAADIAPRDRGGSQAVDVLSLDGSVIRSFGTFSNFSPPSFPFIWSPDGSQVAFVNLNRLYVAPRVTQLNLAADTFGIPPDTRVVYAADDSSTNPSYTDIQFSNDNKYLLMEVYEGFMQFVVVALETGQSTPLTIPHLDPFALDDNYLGVPAFFSWRQ